MSKNKKIGFNKKLLILPLLFICIVVVSFTAFYKKNNQPIPVNPTKIVNKPFQGKTTEPTSTPLYLPIPKNVTKLFELSSQGENQQQVWKFIKSKHKIDDSLVSTMKGRIFKPIIVKSPKSNYHINLSGYEIFTTTIEKESDAISLSKKIEEKILSLGFEKLDINKAVDKFSIVNTYENLDQTFFYKGNELFSISYNKGICNDNDNGSCFVSVSYTNNIDKQIDSQLDVLNKLTDNQKGIYDRNALSSLINVNGASGYINGVEDGAIINGYYIFNIGKYSSDGTTVFAKLNKDNKLDIVGGNSLSDPDYSKISKDTWCSYYGFILNGKEVTDQDSGYIKENCI